MDDKMTEQTQLNNFQVELLYMKLIKTIYSNFELNFAQQVIFTRNLKPNIL